MKKYLCNYRTAVNWRNNNYILCNNIGEIDPSVYSNVRFNPEDEEGNTIDIYQYYLSDASEADVEYLEKTFGLLFSYSELLDVYVLCVGHFGTSWSYVYCETTNELAECQLGETR